MRRHLITLVLTTGTLVSTDATLLSTPTQNKDSVLLPRREPGLASRLDDLDRRAWISGSPDIEFIKRVRRHHHYTDNDEDDSDDEDEDDRHDNDNDNNHQTSTQISPLSHSNPYYTPIFTTSTSTTIISTSTSTNLPFITSSIHPGVTPPPPPPPPPTAGENNGIDGGVADNNGPLNPQNPEGNDGDEGEENNNDNSKVKVIAIATGIVGGLLLLLILLLLWYWFKVRPKRREGFWGQHTILPKDSDIESHVTVDLRNGPHTPHDAGSSSDGLSSHAMSALPVVAAAGAHAGPRVAQAEPYVAMKMAPVASSPSMSHASFTNAYAVPHPAYSQDQPRSYSPMGSSQGAIPPGLPPQGRPSPLQTDAFPGSAPTAMELDGRPPPPRYPDAIATSPVGGSSPTSPLPVSPLSAISPHLSPHVLTTDEPQYHQQQYQGPRQPSYGDYEPSSLPEVVSPICQLGQTSASLPEYDEAAEAARSGVSNHNNLVSQHHLQGGDEKQALPSQQPMSRY
ncbi:hypothetical protein CHU98_g715 [Xylaria longipes]|nr:hypothetical protein CHU98_g715 [Xylaria longipes]